MKNNKVSNFQSRQSYIVGKYYLLLSPFIFMLEYFRDVGVLSLNTQFVTYAILSVLNPLGYFLLSRFQRRSLVVYFSLVNIFLLLLVIIMIELAGNEVMDLMWIIILPFGFAFLGGQRLAMLLSITGFIAGILTYKIYDLAGLTNQMALGDLLQVQSVFLVAALFAIIYEGSRSESERKIIRQVEADPLTGIANRRGIEAVLEGLKIQTSSDGGDKSLFSVVMFDIDNFKSVNDTHGHDKGDTLLVEIAELSQGVLRAADTLGRWGGEEFLVILPETNLIGATVAAEKLCASISSHRFSLDQPVTASFGVASSYASEGLEALFKRADASMYSAKESGKNRVAVSADAVAA